METRLRNVQFYLQCSLFRTCKLDKVFVCRQHEHVRLFPQSPPQITKKRVIEVLHRNHNAISMVLGFAYVHCQNRGILLVHGRGSLADKIADFLLRPIPHAKAS